MRSLPNASLHMRYCDDAAFFTGPLQGGAQRTGRSSFAFSLGSGFGVWGPRFRGASWEAVLGQHLSAHD